MARVRNNKRQRSTSPAEESSNTSKRPKSSLHDKRKRSKSRSPEIGATKRTRRTVSNKRRRADVPSPSSPLSPSKTISSPFPRGEEDLEDDFDELASQEPSEVADNEEQGNEEDVEEEDNEQEGNGGQSQDAVVENPQRDQPELDDRSLFREFTTLSSSPSAVRSTPKERPQTPPNKGLTPPARGSNSSGLRPSPDMPWDAFRTLHWEAYSRSPSGAPHTPANRNSPGQERRTLTSEERLIRDLKRALDSDPSRSPTPPSNQGRDKSPETLRASPQMLADQEQQAYQTTADERQEEAEPIVVPDHDEDADVEMTDYVPVPRPPIDLTASPESSYEPPSPLRPGIFRYYRPGRLRPTDGVPSYQVDQANDTIWTFDYDFSDADDVPKALLQRGKPPPSPPPASQVSATDVMRNTEEAEAYFGTEGRLKWNPDIDDDIWEPENENGDVDFEEGESFEPGSRTKNIYKLYSKPWPTSAWDPDDAAEHREAQKRREEQFDTRMKELDKEGVSVDDLMKTGLGMNRIMRIYHNGAQRGSAPLGEEVGRAQGAVHDRPQPDPSAFVPANFDKRELPARLERKGLEALVRNRDRVKQALDGIHIFFKVCFDSKEWGLTTQQHQQERLRECMRRCRGDAFRSGFEVVSPRDLQIISRVCRFGEAQWKTPEPFWTADEDEDEAVWEV